MVSATHEAMSEYIGLEFSERLTQSEDKFALSGSPFHGEQLSAISVETLNRHWYGHLAGYVNRLNSRIDEVNKLGVRVIEESLIFADYTLRNLMQSRDVWVRNYASGVYNHLFYFEALNKDSFLPDEFRALLEKHFGDTEKMQEAFMAQVRINIGSGYIWMMHNDQRGVHFRWTPNLLNPLWEDTPPTWRGKPLWCVDLWEHAWYLDHLTLDSYVNKIWDTVNWEVVTERAKKYGLL
jgi:superoxide dismutase [Mn]|nr:MAG TPA: Superoxide dismutase [Caudoviricetes sp.]